MRADDAFILSVIYLNDLIVLHQRFDTLDTYTLQFGWKMFVPRVPSFTPFTSPALTQHRFSEEPGNQTCMVK